MTLIEIVAKKRDGRALSREELFFVARSSCNGSAADSLLASWLMAVYLRGMSRSETAEWTRAMSSFGERLNLSKIKGPKLDKHSTGGVGDGISLPLAPLAACAGAVVPMMSGRALGHTGGTLDKLESIPGMKVHLSSDQITRQLKVIGVCMFGQTEEVSPVDRRLYSLRDSTATVESLPLIVSSILSKKIAEDLDGLVLDVKVGSGAFLKDESRTEELAGALVRTAKDLKLSCAALLTGMDQPLGRAIGNALEVRQAIEVLNGEGPEDYVEVLLALGGWMLTLGRLTDHWERGRDRLSLYIRNKEGLKKFKEVIRRQGGDSRVVDDPDRFLPRTGFSKTVLSEKTGFVTRFQTDDVGRLARDLGPHPGAGIVLKKKAGDFVKKGEALAVLYCGELSKLKKEALRFQEAVSIGKRPVRKKPLIRKIIR